MWYPALHAVRGIAAFAVLALHAYWTWPFAMHPATRALYMCVDLFFILSGFVICKTYSNSFPDAKQIGGFMLKRVRRLAPVYYVSGTIWLCAIAGLLFAKNTPLQAADAVEATLNYLFAVDYLRTGEGFRINPVAWSIMVEMAAYLIFAVLFTVVKNTTGRLLLACALAVGGFLALASGGENLNLTTGTEALVRCLSGFFCGVVISTVMKLAPVRGLSILGGSLLIALGAVVYAGFARDFQIFIGLFILIIVLVRFNDHIKVHPALIFMGDISYSLYLWHFIVSVVLAKVLFSLSTGYITHDGERFVEVGAAVGIAGFIVYASVSIALAYLSYRLLERKDLFVRRRPVAAQATGRG